MDKLIIEILPHSFHVRVPYENNRPAIFTFCKSLTEYELVWSHQHRRKIQKAKKTYAVMNVAKDTFGFLLHEYENFIQHVRIYGIRESEIKITHITPPEGTKITYGLPGISPREAQVSILKFMGGIDPTRVLPLPTGQGKTLAALLALSMLGERFVVFAQAGHLNTWKDSILSKTDIQKDEVMLIKGTKALRALMSLGEAGMLHAKAILISSSTFNNYLKEFIFGAEDLEPSYFITPDKFFETIGASVSITDECHEVLHQVVRRAIMTIVKRHFYLSATLDSSNPVINRIYEVIFPIVDRFKDFKNNAHIVVRPTYYRMPGHGKIRYQGPQGYNHGMLEEGILKDSNTKENYMSLLEELLEYDYFKNRKPGTKLLIFAARIEMCITIRDFVATIMPDDCTISKFTAEDPDSVLEDFEIIVSTPKSCGTGRDIPDLMVSIMTPAVASKQLSQQIMGRTRPSISYPDEDPRFYYLTCRSIQKHMDYDIGHVKDFSDKSKSIEPIELLTVV